MHRGQERDPWRSGLCRCYADAGDNEDLLCVMGACACPCIGYAWNYAVGVQKESDGCVWLLPCCTHLVLDGGASALAGYFSGIPYLLLPVGTLLRVVQRRAVEKEQLTSTCVEELFCWGCSIGELNRKLKAREEQHLPPYKGNSILGTLSEPPVIEDSMLGEDEGSVNPPEVLY